jgi:hypothetical protein
MVESENVSKEKKKEERDKKETEKPWYQIIKFQFSCLERKLRMCSL